MLEGDIVLNVRLKIVVACPDVNKQYDETYGLGTRYITGTSQTQTIREWVNNYTHTDNEIQ